MNYDDGDPVPAGYHLEKRTRKGRVVGGSIMFGAAYLGSLIAAAFAADNNDDGYWPLAIPAIGPFMTIATANTPLVKGDGAPGVLLLLDGALQCGGLALAVLGFTDKKTMLIRNDLGLRITPLLGRGVTGLGVSFTL